MTLSIPYIKALQFNLSHLAALAPEPSKNLASSNNGLPPTEADSLLGPQIVWSEISGGPAGTRQTLRVMRDLAREAAAYGPFRRYAVSLFQNASDVEHWLRDHFTYRDENEEVVRSPILMLGDMGRVDGDRVVGLEGDCDDVAALAAAFCLSLQLPTRFVAIRYTPGSTEFEHVVTQALDGESWGADWLTIDPTVRAGTQIQAIEIMVERV